MFSELALERFLKVAPELAPYILTFKDMTEELGDEPKVNVGVFVISAGGSIVFVPVIAKSNTVYPIDSVFLDSEKQFFPLTRSMSNLILAGSSVNVGKKAKVPTYVTSNPSIMHLVNPPKTGKYAYASTGILPEFLAILPDHTKAQLLDKLHNDAELRDGLHNVFGLENLVPSLVSKTPAPATPVTSPVRETARVVTEGEGLSKENIDSILAKGFAILGKQSTNRIVVPALEHDTDARKFQEISAPEQGKVYDIIMRDSSDRLGWLPKFAQGFNVDKIKTPVVIFDNGSWCSQSKFIAKPNEFETEHFLKGLFSCVPPKKLFELTDYETFALLDSSSLNLIGIYRVARSVISDTSVQLHVRDLLNGCNHVIHGVKHLTGPIFQDKCDIFAPMATFVLPLITSDCIEVETSINGAARREELKRLQLLPEILDIRHDGYEFHINGTHIGGIPAIMKVLVEHESINPAIAESFVKQAEKQKKLKLLMSKKADVNPMAFTGLSEGRYPGEQPVVGPKTPTNQNSDLNMQEGNVKQVLGLNDEAVGEATIISELLQDPMMFDTISQYLPIIKEALDKLGRTLFLMRLRSEEISSQLGPATIVSLLTSLRNAYRILGDNYMKLEQLLSNVEPATEPTSTAG